MSYDIYGNPLRRGFCEVHPSINEEWPCCLCVLERNQRNPPEPKQEEVVHCEPHNRSKEHPMLEMNIVQLHKDAVLPVYSTEGAACFDFYAVTMEATGSPATAEYGLGLAVEVPVGWVLALFSRSGHGFNKDIRLSNAVGIIDSDYRGEVKVKLRGDGKHAPVFNLRTDKIVQGMLLPAPKVKFNLVTKLSDTDRGEGGFGHTG